MDAWGRNTLGTGGCHLDGQAPHCSHCGTVYFQERATSCWVGGRRVGEGLREGKNLSRKLWVNHKILGSQRELTSPESAEVGQS